MLYLLVFVGALFILLKSLNKALPKEGFSWLIFFKKNIAETLLNILAGAIIIYSFGIVEHLFQFNNLDFTKFFCVFLGISGQMVFNFLLQLTSKSYKTWFGVNKK